MEEGRRWSEGGIREFLQKNRKEKKNLYGGTGVKKFLWKNREERRKFWDLLQADLYSEGRRLLSIFLVRGLGG